MSGKAPPKGPRALVGGGSTTSTTSTTTPARPPPTGPRSLNKLNGELRHDRPAIHIHTKHPPPPAHPPPPSPPLPPPPPPTDPPPPTPPPPACTDPPPPPEPPNPPPPIPVPSLPARPDTPPPTTVSFTWPPPPSSLPPEKNFKVLFDSAVDVPPSSHTRMANYPPLRSHYHLSLISRIRSRLASLKNRESDEYKDLAERIIAKPLKSSGKEHLILLRHNGSVLDPLSPWNTTDETPELALSPSDPRRDKSIRVPPLFRPPRSDLILLSYEPDAPESPESLLPSSHKEPSSSQPTAVLITHLNPLTPTPLLRHHLSSHGTILSLERPLDPRTGGALGIVWVKFASPEQAKRCVEKDTGRRELGGRVDNNNNSDGIDEEWKIEYDEDGTGMKRVVSEIVEKKKQIQNKPTLRNLSTPRQESSSTPLASGSTTRHPGTATASPLHLGRSPHPNANVNGSTPSTGTLVSLSPHPSTIITNTSTGNNNNNNNNNLPRPPERDRDRERKAANAIAIDAVEQSLRAAREAAGLLVVAESVQVQVSESSPVSATAVASNPASMTALASGSGTGATLPATTTMTTTTAVAVTTNTNANVNVKKKKMNFSWGTLSFGHLTRNAGAGNTGSGTGGKYGLPKYAFPTRYAKYAAVVDEDENEKGREKEEDDEDGALGRVEVKGTTEKGQKEMKEARMKKLGVLGELEENGMEYVVLEVSGRGGEGGGGGGAVPIGEVSDEELKGFFLGFRIEKILRDPTTTSIYITFTNPTIARTAVEVLSTRQIGFRTVRMKVGVRMMRDEVEKYEKELEKFDVREEGAAAGERDGWGEKEMVEEGKKIILGMLRGVVSERIGGMVGEEVGKVLGEEREARRMGMGAAGGGLAGLKGLSFRKVKEVEVPHMEEEEEEEVGERPKKRRRVVDDDEGESEVDDIEEEEETVVPEEMDEGREESVRKKARLSEWLDESEVEDVVLEPVVDELVEVKGRGGKKGKKGAKEKVVAVKKGKKQTKGRGKKKKDVEVLGELEEERDDDVDGVEPIEDEEEVQLPAVVTKKKKAKAKTKTKAKGKTKTAKALPPRTAVLPTAASTPTPTRTPTPVPPALVDPFEEGLCEDDEDLWYVRVVLGALKGENLGVVVEEEGKKEEDPSVVVVDDGGSAADGTTAATGEGAGGRKHLTGSARAEGFYKITHAEKAAYVSQYQTRAVVGVVKRQQEQQQQHLTQHVESSRSNRANARRRAQGLDELNTLQLQQRSSSTGLNGHLSELDSATTTTTTTEPPSLLLFKFNQLQTRKKHLRFARSPIHDWGLYAMEKIVRGEMVIEYVGEIVRAQVAEKREKVYERQGIGSSYLFRIDEDLVVDATMKGNLGRLINHSCDPNCTAKIITIGGEKKIVIYAKQDIELGDEITYDYHFPFEQDKIPCLCGSPKCRGYLN